MKILFSLLLYSLFSPSSKTTFSGQFEACEYHSPKIFGEYISFQKDGKFIYCRNIADNGFAATFCSFGSFRKKDKIIKLKLEGSAIHYAREIEIALKENTTRNRKYFDKHFWVNWQWDSKNFRQIDKEKISSFESGAEELSPTYKLIEDSTGLKLYRLNVDVSISDRINMPYFCTAKFPSN